MILLHENTPQNRSNHGIFPIGFVLFMLDTSFFSLLRSFSIKGIRIFVKKGSFPKQIVFPQKLNIIQKKTADIFSRSKKNGAQLMGTSGTYEPSQRADS